MQHLRICWWSTHPCCSMSAHHLWSQAYRCTQYHAQWCCKWRLGHSHKPSMHPGRNQCGTPRMFYSPHFYSTLVWQWLQFKIKIERITGIFLTYYFNCISLTVLVFSTFDTITAGALDKSIGTNTGDCSNGQGVFNHTSLRPCARVVQFARVLANSTNASMISRTVLINPALWFRVW